MEKKLTAKEKRHIKTLQVYALIAARMSDDVHISMQRSLWYLRPSHHKLMNIWEAVNELFCRYLDLTAQDEQ